MYHGCLVKDGRIDGLCFTHYTQTIKQWIKRSTDITDAERLACYVGLEDGIRHLHGLGLGLNDINPPNIMINSESRPVSIDFDSVRPIGEELGFKADTVNWELSSVELSAPENDFHGLEKIREVILDI